MLEMHSNSISTKSLEMQASRIEKSWLMVSAQGMDERAGNRKGKRERGEKAMVGDDVRVGSKRTSTT